MKIYIECPSSEDVTPKIIVTPQFDIDEDEKYVPLDSYMDGVETVIDLDGDVYDFETILNADKLRVDPDVLDEIEEVYPDLLEDSQYKLAKIATALWTPSVLEITEDMGINWNVLHKGCRRVFNRSVR